MSGPQAEDALGEALRGVLIGDLERTPIAIVDQDPAWTRRFAAEAARIRAALYERTKRRLAEQDWPTVQHYAEAKSEVVEGIIARARAAHGL